MTGICKGLCQHSQSLAMAPRGDAEQDNAFLLDFEEISQGSGEKH